MTNNHQKIKYIAIKKALESEEVEVEIEFLISIKPIFDQFLTRFQKEEPVTHLLHSNCEKLLKTAMERLMQSKSCIDKRHNALKEEDCENVELQLKNDQFKAMQGHSVSTHSGALPEASAKRDVLGMRSFYKAVIKHLQKMLPIEDVVLQALSCLNPREQKSPDGLQYCKVIARAMPSIADEDEVKVGDEWISYQEMELKDDHFWHRIFSKYDEC